MVKSFYFFKDRQRYTPNDSLKYIIPQNTIQDTERILREYSDLDPSNEGLVYWGGVEEKEMITVLMVIAPKTESDSGSVSTSNRANFDFVNVLIENNLIEVAQVHSHPGTWVDHSYGDDEMAAFKVEGLLSIVIPMYNKQGMMPLWKCGIHRYLNGKFKRLSNKYIKAHFMVSNDLVSKSKDLRS